MDADAKPLSEQELRFVDEFLVDHNATRAWQVAFGKNDEDGNPRNYATVRKAASILAAKPHIKREIRAAEAFIARRNRVTADRVVKELAAIAFSRMSDVFDFSGPGNIPVPKDTREIPVSAHIALEKTKIEERVIPQSEGEPITVKTVEYKFQPKLTALEKLYNHLGMGAENEVERLLSILPEDLRARVTVEIERAAATRAIADGGIEGADRPLQLAGRAD